MHFSQILFFVFFNKNVLSSHDNRRCFARIADSYAFADIDIGKTHIQTISRSWLIISIIFNWKIMKIMIKKIMIVYFVITTICGFDNKGTYAVFVTEGDRSDTTNFV